MTTENEEWRDKFAASDANESSREGYKQPYNRDNNRTFNRGSFDSSDGNRSYFQRGDRPMRPRIQRGDRQYQAGSNGEGRSYRPAYSHDNRNGEPRPYTRPRYNNPADGENRPSSYRPYRQPGENGGYNRERTYNREGGYNRDNGGFRREGGYNRNNGYQREGGYNRDNNGYRREGGYNRDNNGFRPRYNNQGGAGNRFGGRQQGYRTADYDPNAKYSHKKQIEYKELNFDPDAPIRLNKFLANAGVCSRREADEFITAGVITVNGEVVTELGTKVKRSDEIKFHDQAVNIERKVYVLLNKPKDYVTTSDDPQNRKTVMELVKNACRERIYPVGRLDRNTTGVLLFTNDGDLASKLTHPKFLKKKIYHVQTDKNVTAADIRQIAEGITLEDGDIRADAIEYASETDKKQVGIEIHSGKNRIVRRIFESLGYRVLKLDRVYFAGLTKKNLRRGDWRFLTEQEVNMLRMGAFE